jgi:hypothetical protein
MRIVSMKQHSMMIALFVTVSTAIAVLLSPFKNWDDLTKKSPDINTATP